MSVLRASRSWPAALPPLVTGTAAAVGVLVVAVVDPNEPGHYPVCPFLAVTGLQCPGCGTLRAVHALVHGDVPAAVELNVLSVLALPVFAWAWWGWLRSSWRGPGRAPTLPAAVAYAVAAVLTIFGVLRNLPWFAPLAA